MAHRFLSGIDATTAVIHQPAYNSVAGKAFEVVCGAHLSLPDSTEASDIVLGLNRTVQWENGDLTVQRAVVVRAPTYAFFGPGTSSSIDVAATVAIEGPPIEGPNADFLEAYAFWIQSGTLALGTGGTNHGSLRVNSSSGYGVTITSGHTTNDYTLTLPIAQGGAATFLQNDGSGVLSWAAGGGGAASLTSTYVGFGSVGNVLSGSSNLTWNNTDGILTATGSSDSVSATVINNSDGIGAYTTFTAQNDSATGQTVLGINSTTYSVFDFGGAGDSFLYAWTGHLYVGTRVANKDLVFLVGGPAASAERMRIAADGTISVGLSSIKNGGFVFNNATNTNTVTLSSGAVSTSYALVLPLAQGGAATFLQNDGSGVLSWASGGGMSNPMTLLGDIIYGGSAGVATPLAGNITTTKKFLTQTGTSSVSAAPSWGTISSTDVSGLTAWATKAYPTDAAGVLTNNGSGTLSWAAASSGNDTISLQACAEGGSYTIAAGVNLVILEPTSTRNQFTLIMPAAPADGSSITILGGNFGVDNLTLSPNSGQSFVTGTAITTMGVGGRAAYEYKSSTARWYRRV